MYTCQDRRRQKRRVTLIPTHYVRNGGQNLLL
nr:MAG TPA: hypothetical protein [Caudoviricetes sp.]